MKEKRPLWSTEEKEFIRLSGELRAEAKSRRFTGQRPHGPSSGHLPGLWAPLQSHRLVSAAGALC